MISKKWLKRVAGGVTLSLLTTTVWLVGHREWNRARGEKELAAAFAQTDATDPDWRWAALNAKRIIPPPDRNGAAVIARMRELGQNEFGRQLDSRSWPPLSPRPEANVRFDPEVIAEARRDLAAAAPTVELARTLKDFPTGNRRIELSPDMLSTQLEDTQYTRYATSILQWDVVVAVEDGDAPLAAANLLAMLNVSRSTGDEPFVVSQLVRIATSRIALYSAEWVLAQARLTDEQLAGLQAAWRADAEEPLFLYGVRGERAAADVLLKNLADGTVTPDTIGGMRKPSGLTFGAYSWWLYRGRYPGERAFYHRWVSQAIAAAKLPLHEQAVAMRRLPDVSPSRRPIVAMLVLPAAEGVSQSYRRRVGEARCAAVGLACERFRLKHGRWPDALDEIPKEILPDVPLDPSDGRPLRYAKRPDGVVVYTLGRNGFDNGGAIERWGDPSDDDGFRLWNPDQRRRPHVPNPAPDAPRDP
jgi:hypothetical protein